MVDALGRVRIVAARGMCLDYHYWKGRVYMSECTSGAKNQRWYMDGRSRLRTAYDRSCADIDRRTGGLMMSRRCHGGASQRFFWLRPVGTAQEPPASHAPLRLRLCTFGFSCGSDPRNTSVLVASWLCAHPPISYMPPTARAWYYRLVLAGSTFRACQAAPALGLGARWCRRLRELGAPHAILLHVPQQGNDRFIAEL